MANTDNKEDAIFTLKELRRQISKKANVVIVEMKVCVRAARARGNGDVLRSRSGAGGFCRASRVWVGTCQDDTWRESSPRLLKLISQRSPRDFPSNRTLVGIFSSWPLFFWAGSPKLRTVRTLSFWIKNNLQRGTWMAQFVKHLNWVWLRTWSQGLRLSP